MTHADRFENPAPGVDCLAREQLEALLGLQRDLLEDVAFNPDHQQTLDRICRAAESFSVGMFATILRYDAAQAGFNVLSAPSVPASAVVALGKLRPGQGSCGNVIVHQEPMFVCDTGQDARWEELWAFADTYGIRSCWAVPIRDRAGTAIGSFALSGAERGGPSNADRRLLDTCAFVIGILLERVAHDHEMLRLAHHDPLTGLANRSLLEKTLNDSVLKADTQGGRVAVLFIDLDQFKNVNDSLGHDVGDVVLVEVARRMQAALVRYQVLSRMGGDEFVIVFDHTRLPGELDTVCTRLLATIAEPIEVEGARLYVNASIGVGIYPRDGKDAMSLLQSADTALFEAKSRGRNTYRFYEPELTRDVLRKIELDNGLRTAVQNDALEYYFQPQVDIRDARVVAMESLIRWRHPERGVIEAREFIGFAEKSGMLNDVNMNLLELAARRTATWRKDLGMAFRLVVNVSAGEISPGYAFRILETLQQCDIEPASLELEITSRAPMSDDPVRIAELRKLDAAGVILTIDDFGAGHSSYQELSVLPFRRLKFDSCLTRGVSESAARAILSSLVVLAKGLDIELVADGVEDSRHSEWLGGLGCFIQQGNFHSPPLEAGAGRAFLAASRSGAGGSAE